MYFKLFILTVLTNQIAAEHCLTPNNDTALCQPLYHCLTLINALATQDPLSIEFVRLSNCGGTAEYPLVCCGSTTNFTIPVRMVPISSSPNVERHKLLPERKYCGYQHSDDFYRLDTSKADINEFPWLALLIYEDKNKQVKPKARCSGSLINNNYILTAAHCVEDIKKLNLTLREIRLGDFNIKTFTDCTNATGLDECSEPVQVFGIKTISIHPDYRQTMNDIALIRLDRKVTYSDYIRPICMPLPGTKLAKPEDILLITGWGQTVNNRELAEVKKKVRSQLLPQEECFGLFKQHYSDNHFCTRDVSDGEDFGCVGDNGGPVIFSNRNQWHLEGIFSFGSSKCGLLPNAHIKVVKYLDWILENMKP